MFWLKNRLCLAHYILFPTPFCCSQGAGRVAFSNQQSYIAAISARFVQLQHGDIDKRVEVKPYVLDDQMCDECQGQRCGGKFAPFFCANVICLQVSVVPASYTMRYDSAVVVVVVVLDSHARQGRWMCCVVINVLRFAFFSLPVPQYYCDQCWGAIHSLQGREYHKPLVKEGADRPRAVPYRWC